MKLSEVGGVGIVTKQNATKDIPVGGEYMNVKKLGLGSGKPKLHDKKATKNTTPNKLFNLGISEDADVLYHATYEPFLKSIMANGLGGAGAQQQWEDSKPGYVYLARDPEVAESHAEANEEVPDEYIDNIVVLAVDTSKLDMDNLEDDPNVLNDDSTLAYKGVIPSAALMMAEGKRIPRKKGQKAGSKKHSDLYTDENPRGTIHGLKFATVADAKASVNKIKRSGKKHAHKIQAAIAMEQRAKAAGKVSAAAVYRKYINAMKKKTKKMNELRIEKPDPKDTLGIKRKAMPQIKSKDYEEFIKFLTKNGVKFTQDTIPAKELRAMQNQFSDEGIIKQMEKNIAQGPNTKSVIVSSDDYILDGHHRWLVAVNTGTDLNVYRVNMPAYELYDLVNQFEKVYYKDIYDETRGSIGVPLSSGLVVGIFPHRPLKVKKSTPGKLRYDETIRETELYDEWSKKYKRSINCNNPKGFSQKAHCAGRKKKGESVEQQVAESFVKPQFDVEWDEAARYPEFQKIGKQAWIELAKTGKAVQITDASDIENTDAADPDSFKSLDPNKQKRALAQLEKGNVEMPIVAVYSDGYKELIGGNTRLTAMMAKDGRATVWQFEVPDEIAVLAEAPKDRDSMNLDAQKLQQSIDYFYKDHAPNKIGGRKEQGNFKGYKVVTFTKEPDTLMFLVDRYDDAVFYVAYSTMDKGIAVGNVRSNGKVRATEVYAYLVDKFGTLYSDDSQTPQGRKIWTDFAKFFPNIEVKDTGERFVASKKAVNEGYVLQLERGKFDAVLHIKDTKTGERMEVRGKPGYEIAYDGKDELHQTLDRIGKAVNVADLMNGERVGVNPKHPQGPASLKVIQDLMKETKDQLRGNVKFTKSAKPGGRSSPHPARGLLVGSKMDEGVNDPHIFKAVFLAGGPGSGKSFVAKKILGGTGLRSINSDEVYEFLMKKQGLSLDPETIFSPQGQEIRDKAKGLSRKREATYLDGRLGLVIDGTGRDVSKYEVMAQKLRAIGYDLSMIYVNTSLEVAQQRNLKRERTLKPEKVEQLWNDVQQNLMKFQQIFGAGRFHIIDNSGGLEDLDRQKNFDKVYVETQRFLNTPPSKPKAKAWIQQQKEQNDEKRSATKPTNTQSDGGTAELN